jgi:hypothetical protein
MTTTVKVECSPDGAVLISPGPYGNHKQFVEQQSLDDLPPFLRDELKKRCRVYCRAAHTETGWRIERLAMTPPWGSRL